jgi:2-oxoglutarate ferredoxin oxidoreductase subunit beta
VAKPLLLDKLVEKAIRKKGFSLVEAMTPCPTTYGRLNKAGDAVEMTAYLKQHSVSQAKADGLSAEERSKAIVTGVLVDVEKPEYAEQYAALVERLRQPAAPPAQGARS